MPSPTRTPPTVDELVDTLKHSSIPTVLVEGNNDEQVYRWIESKIGIFSSNVLPCGGRDRLLQLYARRTEFGNLKCAFVADKDMWLFTAVPTIYTDIIFTEGYSIENDIYVHSDIERLLDASEAREHRLVLEAICRWFAFEVEEYRAGRPIHVECHINEIVPPHMSDIDHRFASRRGFREPAANSLNEILGDYQVKLRGKQLFQILVRFLSAPSRGPKYSISALNELCVKTKGHPGINKLVTQIKGRLK